MKVKDLKKLIKDLDINENDEILFQYLGQLGDNNDIYWIENCYRLKGKLVLIGRKNICKIDNLDR